jgi:hypothetical protein
MNKKQQEKLAKQWLEPIDSTLADLLDKADRMTIGAFRDEVAKVIERIPNMFYLLDKKALETALEDAMGDAAIKAIKRNL